MKRKTFIALAIVTLFWSCSSESITGNVVGFITHFSNEGLFWKSWEVEINSSQTGMTSTANEVDLSVDNDNPDQNVINQLDSAQKYGWKVSVDYEQHFGTNCCDNRGNTSKFIKSVTILDKNPLGGIKDNTPNSGKTVDTIYVVIDKSK